MPCTSWGSGSTPSRPAHPPHETAPWWGAGDSSSSDTSQGASTQNPSNDEPRAIARQLPGVTSTQKGNACGKHRTADLAEEARWPTARSEERRVGKGCRWRGWEDL